MKILEKQPVDIERENLEILALGFDIPLAVMGFKEVKREDYEEHKYNSTKLIRWFDDGNLMVTYEIRQNSNGGYLFDWVLYGGPKRSNSIRRRSGMGNFESFEFIIDYIAEQSPIIRQTIEKQKERIAV